MKNFLNINPAIFIALVGSMVLISSNGLTYSGITVFDEALLTEFGWTKSELKFRDFLNLACLAILGPIVGILIDRYGAKRIVIGGLLTLAVLYYSYAYISDVWHMYALHLGLSFAVAGAGGLAVVILISERVIEKRGMALGIALAGTSIGGIIIPQIGTRLLAEHGWRLSFQYEALIPVVVAILVFFLLKPVIKSNSEETDGPGSEGHTFMEAIKTPVFWAICLSGVFCFYAIMGTISNLFLYLREMGFSAAKASNAFSIFFAVILVAKFASGLLTEYINPYKVFRAQLLLMLIGTVGLAFNSEDFLWPAIVAVGLGWGGLYTLFNYIIITAFGLRSAGKIGGVITSFEGVGSGLGAWLTGLISDRTGSYSASFWVIVGLLAVAWVISLFVRPVKKSMSD